MARKTKIVISWSPSAVNDLLEIHDYLRSEYSPDFAESSVVRIRAVGAGLAAHPRLWRERPEIVGQVRLAPVRRYFICYTVLSRGVEILRIIHNKRDIVGLFAAQENRL